MTALATVSLLGFLLSMAVCVGVLPVVIRALRAQGLVDVPNQRSSHQVPILRGAGIAIWPSLVAASLVAQRSIDHLRLLSLLVLVGFCLLGFLEDLRGLPIRLRLVGQFVLGLVSSLELFGFGFSALAAAAFVAAVVNAFNFMDGINGVSAATAAIAGLTFAAAGLFASSSSLAILGAVVAGAALGFLPFNFPVARVFLGDSGSYLLGAALAVGALLAVEADIPLVVAIAPLAIYGADTLSTVLNRLASGKTITEPHRDHVYQSIADHYASHVKASGVVSSFNAAVVGASAISATSFPAATAVSIGLVFAICATYLSFPRFLGGVI